MKQIKMEMYVEGHPDEYSTRDQPVQPSFYDHYGFNELDGPPEEDDSDDLIYRRLLLKSLKPLTKSSPFTGALFIKMRSEKLATRQISGEYHLHPKPRQIDANFNDSLRHVVHHER